MVLHLTFLVRRDRHADLSDLKNLLALPNVALMEMAAPHEHTMLGHR